MQEPEDTDSVVGHVMDENIVGMDDQLARVREAAGPIGERQGERTLGSFANPCLKPESRGKVVLGDEFKDAAQIAPGVSRPDELALHDAFR